MTGVVAIHEHVLRWSSVGFLLACVCVLSANVPSAPINVTAITDTPTSINISWNGLPLTNTCSVITVYEVQYTWRLSNGQLGISYMNTSGAQTYLILNELQECVQYSISVRAYTTCSQGPGPFSDPVLDSSLNEYAEVPQPPEVPISALTATSANLNWSCPLEKNFTITSYSVNVTVVSPRLVDVKCLNGQNFSYYITVPGYQRYVELKNMSLIPYTAYTFDVLANTTVEVGEVSSPQSFTTLQAPPTSPLNVTVNVLSYSNVLISWNPPKCSNGIISGYTVMYSPPTGSPSSPYSVTNTSNLLLQNMLNNTVYTISLCACTAGGCGPNAVIAAMTPSAPPSNPSVLYLRMSSLTNVDNHQNDEALLLLQDELFLVANYCIAINISVATKVELEVVCTAVQSCENDVTNGWSRIECKIMIYHNLDIQKFISQLISAINATSSALDLAPYTLSISATEFCSCDLNSSSGGSGTYSWPEAAIGQTIFQMCQYGVVGQNITRLCNGDLTWTEDASQCPTVVTNQFRQLNAAIQNQTITAQNVVNVSSQLQAVVSQATQMVDQSTSNLAVVTNVITQISNISSTVPIQPQTIINVVAVLSSIQTWPPSVLSTSGSVVVEKFEIIATNLVQQQNFTELRVIQKKIVLIAQKLPIANLTIEGKTYSTVDDTQTSGGSTNTTVPPPTLTASVALPPSMFSSIATNSNITDVGIFVTTYNTASFFPLTNTSKNITITPLVFGITVVGAMTNNLTNPVVLNFTITNAVREIDNHDGTQLDDVLHYGAQNYSNYLCVSWNFQAAGGAGNWTTDGCVTYVRQSNQVASKIECQCFHLTNFAILVDISSRVQPNEPPNKSVQRAIEFISYIGVALSLLGLVLALISLLLIKKLRQKDVSKFHIQLCSALIGMLLVFVVGIDKTKNFGGCVTVSVLIHYFTLVAVMWMGAEALFMFQKIVVVFIQMTTRYITVLSLICWVVPLVPVVIPLSIDRNLLVKQNSTEGYCFINNVTVLIAAFLGPILLVLAFNAVIFVVVIVVLVKHLIKRSKQANYNYRPVQLMANITGISCLLGLTWAFGALTIIKADHAFQIVFTVSNSLQGFFIFIFFCVLNGDVRLAWTQKILGKRPTTKPKSSIKPTSRSTQFSLKPPYSTELILSHDHVISEQSESFYPNDAYRVAPRH